MIYHTDAREAGQDRTEIMYRVWGTGENPEPRKTCKKRSVLKRSATARPVLLANSVGTAFKNENQQEDARYDPRSQKTEPS